MLERNRDDKEHKWEKLSTWSVSNIMSASLLPAFGACIDGNESVSKHKSITIRGSGLIKQRLKLNTHQNQTFQTHHGGPYSRWPPGRLAEHKTKLASTHRPTTIQPSSASTYSSIQQSATASHLGTVYLSLLSGVCFVVKSSANILWQVQSTYPAVSLLLLSLARHPLQSFKNSRPTSLPRTPRPASVHQDLPVRHCFPHSQLRNIPITYQSKKPGIRPLQILLSMRRSRPMAWSIYT